MKVYALIFLILASCSFEPNSETYWNGPLNTEDQVYIDQEGVKDEKVENKVSLLKKEIKNSEIVVLQLKGEIQKETITPENVLVYFAEETTPIQIHLEPYGSKIRIIPYFPWKIGNYKIEIKESVIYKNTSLLSEKFEETFTIKD